MIPFTLKDFAFWALLAVIAALPISISFFEISVTVLILLTILSVVLDLKSFRAKREISSKEISPHFVRRNDSLKSIFSSATFIFLFLILLYFAANLLSLTASDYPDASTRGILKVLKNIFLCLSAFYVVDSEEKLRKVFQWFLVVAIVICADALVQGITGFELLRQRPLTDYFGETKRLTGPFSHANNFSAYLSFVVILFLGIVHEGRRIFSIQRYAFFLLGFFIAFLCLLGTYSRGAWAAVGVTVVLYAVVRRSKSIIFTLMVIVVWGLFFSPPHMKHRVLSFLDSKDGTVNERRELWGESFQMIQKSPWVGLGINTYARNEPLYKRSKSKTGYQYAHNGYLQMMAEIGTVGLLSFLGVIFYFLIATLITFWKANETFLKTAGVALVFGILSFVLHSLTDTDLHSILLVNTLWLAMGVAWSARELCRKSAGSSS